ncbi:MAG: Ldh family oxidoreductase [Desulfitobacteriaceae bacterium]
MEYPFEKLSEFCLNLLASVDVPADDAQVVASVLIDTSLEGIAERLSDMIRGIKSVPLAEGYSEIRIPGEKRQRIMRERRKSGIPVSQALLKELNHS